MPIDVLLAAAVINRWIAIPLLAAVWAFGHGSSAVDGYFTAAFLVSALYGAIGIVARRAIAAEAHDPVADWRASHPHT